MALDVTEESKIKESWTEVKFKLPPSSYDFMVAHKNRLYFWGTESYHNFDAVIGFDIEISVMNLPNERIRFRMDRAIIYEDHIYALGLWITDGVGAFNYVFKYDLATGSWLEGTPMLTKRSQ